MAKEYKFTRERRLRVAVAALITHPTRFQWDYSSANGCILAATAQILGSNLADTNMAITLGLSRHDAGRIFYGLYRRDRLVTAKEAAKALLAAPYTNEKGE